MILHVDMDAFYASIEQRDDPALRGRPVIVGGLGGRGVVATASYEARRFGVRSAMPGFEARKRCPEGVFVRPRMEVYAAESARLMALLATWSPVVEPLSLDEAFLDLAGSPLRRRLAWAEIAEALRAAIRAALGVTASVGIATTKYVAKVASDHRKPDGWTVVAPGTERAFLAPMPVERLWGAGPRTAGRLRDAGLETLAHVAAAPPTVLARAVGARMGVHMQALARGEDPRPVRSDRTRHSLGAERTLEANIEGWEAAAPILRALCEEVASGLRRRGLQAVGCRLKGKTAGFRSWTREQRWARPADTAAALWAGVQALAPRGAWGEPQRLLGVIALLAETDAVPVQGALFEEAGRDPAPAAEGSPPGAGPAEGGRSRALEQTLDAVRARFGAEAVRRADAWDPRTRRRGSPP
jgi:DNA polymerase-4